MDAISEKVHNTIEKHRLIDSGDRILVALSGGPDSVALLHLLLDLKSKYNIDLSAAHLDHGLRAGSSKDRQFCRKMCASLKIKLYSRRIDIRALARREKMSIEEAGRKARYHYFESLAGKFRFNKIATGHTLDDNVETVIFNLARGAGLAGISGIPIKRGIIIRPLIEIDKNELIAWLKAGKIPYRTDRTNLTGSYSRNRIRLNIIPELESINREAKRNIARLTMIASEESELLAALGVRAYEDVLLKSDNAKIVLDLGKLQRYDKGLRKKVVEEAFGRLNGRAENLPFETLSRALSILMGKSGLKAPLAHGIFIEKSLNRVALVKSLEKSVKIEPAIPGTTDISSVGSLEAEILDISDVGDIKADGKIGNLDYDKISDVEIKFWKNGDCIRPLGMRGKKLLSDIFVDCRIPEFERRQIPLIVSGGKIAWIAGMMVSDDFKVTKNTRRVLRLKLCAT